MREYHIIDVNGNSLDIFPETLTTRGIIGIVGSYPNGLTLVGADGNHYPVIAILVDTIMVGNPLI